MANVQISQLADAILPIDTTNTFFELQTVEGGIQVSRKLSAQDLGIGGGVTSVNSGVNITVDNTDPQQPIVNLPVNITGQQVNSVTLSAAGVATNYLDETGNYSVPAGSAHTLQDAYDGGNTILLNGTPDPIQITASVSGQIMEAYDTGANLVFQVLDTGVIAGDPGFEGAGIDVGGTLYDSVLKASTLGGTNIAQFIMHRHSSSFAPFIVGSRSQGDTSAHVIVNDGDELLRLWGVGWDGATYQVGASMGFRVDGTPGAGDMPGEIVWSTTPDGSAGVVERMRLRQDGQFEIDNNITLLERAAAFGSVATRGQFWVRNDTPNVPMFTDDTGADFVLNAGGGGVTVEDEGTPLATVADTLNFVGAGVTASGAGTTKTITIPGGGGGVNSVTGGSNITNSGTAADPILDVDDPLIISSINATSSLNDTTTGSPYLNVPLNIGANLVGTQGMTQYSRQRIQARPSSFGYNSTLFINIQGEPGTNGANTIIGGLNSANIEVDFGVAVRLQHGGSGLHVMETIDTGIYLEQGSCFIQEKATAETNTAGRGELWVRNDAPNVLVFTDDTGVDTVLGAGGGGITATPTPASGEVAVWDSTGATLAGEPDLFYTGTTLRINNGLGGACLDLRDGNSTGSAAAVSLNLTDQVGTVIGQVGVALGITLLQCDAGQVSVVAGIGGTAKFTADALSFQLEEQSAPGLNTAGYGQWWVRDHVPNQPWFTDDADIDYPVGYGRPRFFTTNASYDMNTGANAENCINGQAYFDDGSPYTITLEDSTSTEFDVNTPFQIVNAGSGTITVAEGTGDTLFVLDGTAGTVTDAAGSATLGTGAVATVQRTAAGTWLIWGSGITP